MKRRESIEELTTINTSEAYPLIFATFILLYVQCVEFIVQLYYRFVCFIHLFLFFMLTLCRIKRLYIKNIKYLFD